MENIDIDDLSLELLYSLLKNHVKNSGEETHEIARPGNAGFVPAQEGASLLHGVVGAKGSLLNLNPDLNQLTHGGVYLFGPNDVKNSPWGVGYMSGNSTLIVIRNFSDNPDANDNQAMIFQFVISHNQTPDIAFRYCSGGSFRNWKYLTGYSLWAGSQSVLKSTFELNKSIRDFDKIEIEYVGINSNAVQIKQFKVDAATNIFDIRDTNLPDDQNNLIAIQFGEIRLSISSDGRTLTSDGTTCAIRNGQIESDGTIADVMRIRRIKGLNKI